ncbi:MAG: FG-GAP-like repeat-containing protein [Planctomycetota bacterium]
MLDTPRCRFAHALTVVASCVVVCSCFSGTTSAQAPLIQAPFTEEATPRGIVMTTMGLTVYGYGMALNDFDNDGDLDLAATGLTPVGTTSLFENTGNGTFVDRTMGSGIPPSPYNNGLSAADYDGDGDLDLYLSGFLTSNILLRNDGAFVFVDVTAAAGVGGGPVRTQGTTWGDYDGDGWLDLYVCNRFAANQLFRNNGDGTFVDVAPTLGVDDDGLAYQAAFFDYDLDDDVDLYLANEARNTPKVNRHWRNDAGALVDVGPSNGSNIQIDSMGLAVGDYDRNGGYDLYITNDSPGNALLQESGLAYSNVGSQAGVLVNALCWGTLFVDYDNDRLLDVFVAASHHDNRLLRNTGLGWFVDVTASTAIGSAGYNTVQATSSYCCVAGDVDDDGDLDMLVQTSGEPLALYINHEGALRSWLKVRLRDLPPNRFAVGAHVRVVTGSIQQQQPLLAGVGLKSSNPMDLHFGLGSATVADQVVVRWPDGGVSILPQVTANQTLVVHRSVVGSFVDCNRNFIDDAVETISGAAVDCDGNGVPDSCEEWFLRGDVDSDGQRNIVDAIVTIGALFGIGTLPCADAADSNDDGALDLVDPIYLLQYLLNQGTPPPAPLDSCAGDPSIDGAISLDCQTPQC